MTEPQIWTIIGVFAATLVALVTIVTQSFTRSISSLRDEMVLRFEHQGEKFGRLETRMDRLEKRVDDIDRDMLAISKRLFPEQ